MCGCHDVDAVQDAETDKMLARRRLVQGLAAGGLLTATTGLSGCSTNPETGEKQFLLVGDSQLSQMAAASWADAKSKTPTSNDPRYTRRLQTIGGRIARGANKHNERWDYEVFDQDTRNAFVLPGNRVGFYKGMMDFADNDDQIAGIMGHEVGHVTGRHAAARVSQQMAGQLAVVGGTVLGGSQLQRRCRSLPANQQRACFQNAARNTRLLNGALGMGLALGVLLPYSRRHESQSDLLGAKYMYKAGYDPYQSVRLWEKMAEASPRRQPELLSTHPDPARRARDLHNYIKSQENLGSQGWESIKFDKKA